MAVDPTRSSRDTATVRRGTGPAGIVRFRAAAALLSCTVPRRPRVTGRRRAPRLGSWAIRRRASPSVIPAHSAQRRYGDVTVLRSGRSRLPRHRGRRRARHDNRADGRRSRAQATFLQGVIAADSALAMGADRSVMEAGVSGLRRLAGDFFCPPRRALRRRSERRSVRIARARHIRRAGTSGPASARDHPERTPLCSPRSTSCSRSPA